MTHARFLTSVRAATVSIASLLAAVTNAQPAGQGSVTFSKDIAPIVFTKCASCHQPDGPAPFSLLSFASARRHATQMARATRSGYMPPWKAEPGVGGEFVGQDHLTDREIDLIARWAAAGAPEGNRGDLPPVPRPTAGWQLGRPDLVVTPPAYTLPADGPDVFRVFVIPLPVNAEKIVRGLEFHSGNQRVVHHANIRVDRTAASRRLDDEDPAPGYEGIIARSATYPDGYFLGWTPGQVSPLLPKGLGWTLAAGSDLVVEVHMQPSGKPETVQPSIGIFFGSDPPTKTPSMLRLGRQNIDIAPGEKAYTVTDSFVLPVDVEVQAVQPHAHYRAREMWGSAALPDGSTRPLIHIKDWDFRWQHVYRYVNTFPLPKGTVVSMRYTYDNSAENPRNPAQPPRRVYWGQRSTDEMGDLWIQVLTGGDRDLQTLDQRISAKIMAEDVIGYERWILSDPKNVALHDDVANLYLDLNRPGDAVRHFATSVELRPGSPAAHFNLGTALAVSGQIEPAIRSYEQSLKLKPDYPQAHNNLGSVLLRTGHVEEGTRHLLEAVRLDPDDPQSQYNAGAAMRAQGRIADAVEFYRRALHLRINWPPVLSDLAWLLAVADDGVRDPALAVRLAERAVTLTGRQDAGALDSLAAAYAASGDYDRAADAARAALKLSPPNSSSINDRLALYVARRPYRLSDR